VLSLIIVLSTFIVSGSLFSFTRPTRLPSLGGVALDWQVPYQVTREQAATARPTRVVIPKLGVNTAIVNVPKTSLSWDVSRLTWQAGHLEGTAYPGQGGNVVLGAHRYLGINYANPSNPGPFVALDRLQPGDLIQVYAGGNVYTYRMTQQLNVSPTDVWVVSPTNTDTLTLMTCNTWNPQTLTFDQRLVVRAELIEVQ
jgi:sortase A